MPSPKTRYSSSFYIPATLRRQGRPRCRRRHRHPLHLRCPGRGQARLRRRECQHRIPRHADRRGQRLQGPRDSHQRQNRGSRAPRRAGRHHHLRVDGVCMPSTLATSSSTSPCSTASSTRGTSTSPPTASCSPTAPSCSLPPSRTKSTARAKSISGILRPLPQGQRLRRQHELHQAVGAARASRGQLQLRADQLKLLHLLRDRP